MKSRSLVIGGVFVWILCLGRIPSSRAQPGGLTKYSLRGNSLVIDVGVGLPREQVLPCAGSALLRHQQLLYVACGAQGMLVLSLAAPVSPKLVSRRTFNGTVVGFFVQEGRVWVKIARLEARPLGPVATGLRPVERLAPVGQPPGRPPRERAGPTDADGPSARAGPRPPSERTVALSAVGRVLSTKRGVAVVDIGTRHGLKRGQRVRVFLKHRVKMDGGEEAMREETLSVGLVVAVSANRAQVRLGSNENVPKGAYAEATTAGLTVSIVAPPRVGSVFSFKFMLRPIIPVGNAGFGAQLELWATYRFRLPIAIHLLIDPLGFAVGKGPDGVAFAGHALLAADLRLFEIGVGVGGTSLNTGEGDEPAFSMNQYVRLGALDGFNFEVHNVLVWDRGRFEYAGTTGGFQIPVGTKFWLLFRGGYRMAGYWFGEAGLRARLMGNGTSGSLFLTATVGAASVFDRVRDSVNNYYRDVSYLGPMGGLGMEWRL
ncbi:MAG: hypothetical protein ABI333_00795 [bacterium]